MDRLEFISPPSPFAQIIDQLRGKTEAELKLLYLRFFKDDLTKEWEQITGPANFIGVSEEDIITAIQQNRYQE